MTPATTIFALVRSVFSLSQAVREQLATNARLRPMLTVVRNIQPRNVEALATSYLGNEALFGPQGPLPDYREENADIIRFHSTSGYFLTTDADPERRQTVIEDLIDIASGKAIPWRESYGTQLARAGTLDLRDEFYLAEIKHWVSHDESRQDRNAIIVALAQTGLNLLSAGSHKLGIGADAQRVVTSVATSLDSYFDTHREQFVETAFTRGAPKRMFEMFLSTSLDIAANQPELLSDQTHVKAVVAAVAEPLRSLNAENALSGGNLTQRVESIRQAIRGPVLLGMLETLHTHRTQFFGDYPDKQKAAGVVTEALFTGLIEQAQASPDNVLQIFSEGFVQRTYPLVLSAVAETPEAFIRGKGQHVLGGQELLTSLSRALGQHSTVARNPDLAADLFAMGMDITRRHARKFAVDEARTALTQWAEEKQSVNIMEDGSDEPWAAVGLRIVSTIADGMITQFEQSGLSTNLIAGQIDQPLMLEIVGMVAEQVAETPGMVLPNDVNDEVVQIAKGVAAFIANENAGLLTQRDWKQVSATAVDLAMKNPGALFSIDEHNPTGHLAVQLVNQMLNLAATSLREQSSTGATALKRSEGRLLFGETLARALMATLELAVSNARVLLQPRSLPAMLEFAQTLNQMAAGSEHLRGRQMTADDWIYAFRWFAADAIADPDQTIDEEDIAAVLDSAERRVMAASSQTETPATPAEAVTPPFFPTDGDDVIHPVPREGAQG